MVRSEGGDVGCDSNALSRKRTETVLIERRWALSGASILQHDRRFQTANFHIRTLVSS